MDLLPSPEVALRVVASRQHFSFTRVHALECGWTASGVAAAVGSGAWKVLHRGVYVEQAVWEQLNPRDRHLCLTHGRLLLKHAAWMAGRRSAARAATGCPSGRRDLPSGSRGSVPGSDRNTQIARNAGHAEADSRATGLQAIVGSRRAHQRAAPRDTGRAPRQTRQVEGRDASARSGLSGARC